ncbi:N-formylglutamate amidohydrolase [Sulfitobacter aestuariivivens]|uniref:N-formylglutamate amidohydrolase n=1 Tax=Sulfitobacter aestuariivivens TaxID=2766981 RepID=A0A927D2N9_9RHOB|nr:N-formylglutamate amidohydrolase [Sulfitobacter aestuariivivens]MBD3663920.1 N-formylglutamate amidohydrolase [Sulfitobacter aestuariivivens]
MNHLDGPLDETIVDLRAVRGGSRMVIVCEHASAHIPLALGDLGLADDALLSHVVWDPGAMGLAEQLAARLQATLVAAKTSRLVYDCNRPPDAADAMPARTEVGEVPGNAHLTDAQKSDRIRTYYEPFRAAVAGILAGIEDPVLVTVHSFTPVFYGTRREVEIGILHDSDARLADALLARRDPPYVVRRNAPYGPADGVTHTLKVHALPGGFLNVMIEVRNDLIADAEAQAAMADMLAGWIEAALADLKVTVC